MYDRYISIARPSVDPRPRVKMYRCVRSLRQSPAPEQSSYLDLQSTRSASLRVLRAPGSDPHRRARTLSGEPRDTLKHIRRPLV